MNDELKLEKLLDLQQAMRSKLREISPQIDFLQDRINKAKVAASKKRKETAFCLRLENKSWAEIAMVIGSTPNRARAIAREGEWILAGGYLRRSEPHDFYGPDLPHEKRKKVINQ